MPKKSRSRGKKKKKPGKSTSKYKKYSGKDGKGRVCPKCGPAVFMGEHKDRYACGKCGYMEKIKK